MGSAKQSNESFNTCLGEAQVALIEKMVARDYNKTLDAKAEGGKPSASGQAGKAGHADQTHQAREADQVVMTYMIVALRMCSI